MEGKEKTMQEVNVRVAVRVSILSFYLLYKTETEKHNY